MFCNSVPRIASYQKKASALKGGNISRKVAEQLNYIGDIVDYNREIRYALD